MPSNNRSVEVAAAIEKAAGIRKDLEKLEASERRTAERDSAKRKKKIQRKRPK
jgi:hypothetical protein